MELLNKEFLDEHHSHDEQGGTLSLRHLYQFLFLCRLLPNVAVQNPPSHAHEVREMAWFAEHALPEDLAPGHKTRIPYAFRAWHGEQRAYFD